MSPPLDPARCAHCPVDPARPCEGLRVRRLCALVDPDDPSYNPAYRSLLEQPPAGATTPDEPDPVQPAPATFGLTETLALLRRMKACPDRRARTDCGCAGLARCERGKGKDGLVNHRDCFGCLRPSG